MALSWDGTVRIIAKPHLKRIMRDGLDRETRDLAINVERSLIANARAVVPVVTGYLKSTIGRVIRRELQGTSKQIKIFITALYADLVERGSSVYRVPWVGRFYASRALRKTHGQLDKISDSIIQLR